MRRKYVVRRDALVRVSASIMQLQSQPPSWRLKRRKIRRLIHTALLISLRVEVGRETMGFVSFISRHHEDCVSFHLASIYLCLSLFPSFHLQLFLSNLTFIRSTLSCQFCSSGGVKADTRRF